MNCDVEKLCTLTEVRAQAREPQTKNKQADNLFIQSFSLHKYTREFGMSLTVFVQ